MTALYMGKVVPFKIVGAKKRQQKLIPVYGATRENNKRIRKYSSYSL